MNTHFQSKGKIFNSIKKWSDLKSSQREWITNQLRDEYLLFIVENGKKPNPRESEKILNKVYTDIERKEIWIPYGEVRKRWNVVKDVANRAVPDK